MNDAGLNAALDNVRSMNQSRPLGTGGPDVEDLADSVALSILNPIITLLFALALLFFIWGVVEFVRGADNEKIRAEGRSRMLWGLIGMLVMISVFAIVEIIQNTIA
jgi:hypothetical protein